MKNTKFDALVPVLLIAVVNSIAVQNVEFCIMIFVALPAMVASYYIYCAKKCAKLVAQNSVDGATNSALSSRTNFFVIFAICSSLYLLGLFEFFVPLLELLPQENFVFIVLIFVSVFLFYKVSETCEDFETN